MTPLHGHAHKAPCPNSSSCTHNSCPNLLMCMPIQKLCVHPSQQHLLRPSHPCMSAHLLQPIYARPSINMHPPSLDCPHKTIHRPVACQCSSACSSPSACACSPTMAHQCAATSPYTRHPPKHALVAPSSSLLCTCLARPHATTCHEKFLCNPCVKVAWLKAFKLGWSPILWSASTLR